ncbi:MAG: Gfo/Idh/MocA family protein [Vicinamibacteria bacterium]
MAFSRAMIVSLASGTLVLAMADARAQLPPAPAAEAPLRVAMAGLVHDHALGFLERFRQRADLRIVGIAERDPSLVAVYVKRFGLDPSLFHDDLDAMIEKVHPQALLAYGDTRDHRRVVELCARRHVPVMMEKPLAVSLDDARAIEKAARAGGIPVLVNYETTWYRSNKAAYDLAHQGAIGEIRKVVVHDGHRGPREIGVSPTFLDWLTDPERNGGGALFDFGCYGADLMTWLMDGRRPDSVTAVTQQIKPAFYPHVDDEATILLTYPRAQAILQASWNWPFGRKDMEVYGASGSAITVGSDSLRVHLPDQDERLVEAKALPESSADSVAYLRAVVQGGLKPEGLSSLETNMVVTEILDAARRSAAEGRTVLLGGLPRQQ